MAKHGAPAIVLLIPALLTDETDVRLLTATVAGVPPSLAATIVPAVQCAGPESAALADAARSTWSDQPARLRPLWLGAACGKWGALREAFERCPSSPWVGIADGDDAYELDALVEMTEVGGGAGRIGGPDLIQGERRQIVLDDTDLGRRRALLEPVVNELLGLRLEAAGTPFGRSVFDLQSGLLLVRRTLLADFFAQPRMDAFWPSAAAHGASRPPLPWGHYGGELHLHAFAALRRAAVVAHPVRSRAGRVSGQTPAGIGRQLRSSALFADVTAGEVAAATTRAARRLHWSVAEQADVILAAQEAFPGTVAA